MPVVLIHGVTDTTHVWDAVRARLDRSHERIGDKAPWCQILVEFHGEDEADCFEDTTSARYLVEAPISETQQQDRTY